ncbi:MAG: hypothetical protein Q8R85_14955 [Bosea sp. (in: a-proteobacteria)]|jgi:hypothetical protein|uniref:hypothetical protein n=1 Tax=unclassified Bosea (in: a-proteobacteria) TaxID=2653178 RepID=UPI00083DC14C|nr:MULTISPECIES: hypothetical protein [unclassified Bosea (in: a-proteobacteria)]MBA4269692.1 hypothetical protein [Methylobacterium sp.]MCZ8044511.1 hypothetical protein [Beijerinckiaceae bacterium]OYW68099.1 MAG: hypothetical protein B7Z40_04260 [Bosea sp. 12-68-7]OYX03239.1 MAG: hypothetical protein B7Z14_01065 [Bosea sp. 32-68-6]AOG03691.1 hypothetical protein BSY19_53 [Bosea sp. RAC05]|eukprot:gene56089-biopygen46387
MGQVLQFRLPPARDEVQPGAELDLLSAVDFALRDLIDIANHVTLEAVREQAKACHAMLAAAYDAEFERA